VSFNSFKTATAMLLLSPYVPMLFQGQEWSSSRPFYFFIDPKDSEHADATKIDREGQLKGAGWEDWASTPDPNKLETFSQSKLNWTERRKKESKYSIKLNQDMIAFRSRYLNATVRKTIEVEHPKGAEYIAVKYALENKKDVVIIYSFSKNPQTIELPFDKTSFTVALDTEDKKYGGNNANKGKTYSKTITLNPGEAVAGFSRTS
jgi:maltooligosyltrehalose trehalohydrolase